MLDLHAVILEDLEHIVSQPVSWDKLQGKTVLVTGASGMIASYLVFTLLYLNDTRHLNIRVLALVRNGEKAKQQFGNILVRSDITLLIQDVSQVLDYSGPVDYIVHAASQASPRFFTTDPVGTIQANTMGTENMLRTAMERKSEGFLYLSTRVDDLGIKYDADQQNAAGEASSCQTISETLVNDGDDLIFTIATPASAGIMNRSKFPKRSLAKAICLPSGDHTGFDSYES